MNSGFDEQDLVRALTAPPTAAELAEESTFRALYRAEGPASVGTVVPLRSGTVVDMRDGRTECEPGTHVQICVAAPVGDAEIEI